MIIHFNEGTSVEVSQDTGEWQAWEAGTYDCDCDENGFFATCSIGYGSTMMEAIADLHEKIQNDA